MQCDTSCLKNTCKWTVLSTGAVWPDSFNVTSRKEKQVFAKKKKKKETKKQRVLNFRLFHKECFDDVIIVVGLTVQDYLEP